MSAVNVLVQSSAVHLLTDALLYQLDGTVAGQVQKVRTLPHLNCAAAMRGAYIGLAPIMEEISATGTSFDSLKANISALMCACASHYGHLLSQCEAGPEFEVIVAGISETAGPSAYIVPSHDRYGKPFAVTDLAGLVLLPCDDHLLAGARRIADGRSVGQIDPVEDGIVILESQRARRRLSTGEDCFIGGYAQLTTITGDGVTSRIIHRWDDRIGKRIAA